MDHALMCKHSYFIYDFAPPVLSEDVTRWEYLHMDQKGELVSGCNVNVEGRTVYWDLMLSPPLNIREFPIMMINSFYNG